MNEPQKLPCEECGKLKLSCCKNPQILFTMMELDNIITTGVEKMQGKVLFKGEVPGTVYIINRPPEGVDTVSLDWCAFYDEDNQKCSIYEQRPNVCKTYGDPKYNRCPYDEYTEPGELQKLNEENPKLALSLHKTIGSNPEAYLEDYLRPWVEAFEKSKEKNPEYNEFWEGLPTPNFIRDQSIKDSFGKDLIMKETK